MQVDQDGQGEQLSEEGKAPGSDTKVPMEPSAFWPTMLHNGPKVLGMAGQLYPLLVYRMVRLLKSKSRAWGRAKPKQRRRVLNCPFLPALSGSWTENYWTALWMRKWVFIQLRLIHLNRKRELQFLYPKQSYIAFKDAGVLFRAQRINISISWQ